MSDIALHWNPETFSADLSAAFGGIVTGNEIASAVIMSVFTWRRAKPDDVLPEGESSRYGWWADSYAEVEGDRIGSRLWLARRRKLDRDTINFVRDCVHEALAWMTEDGVASKIDITLERQGLSTLAIGIVVVEPDGARTALGFSLIWEALKNGR